MRIDLNGLWQATEHLGHQARAGKPGASTALWRTAPVPGYFTEVAGLKGNHDRLLYRRAVTLEALAPGVLARLHLDGTSGETYVWFNGQFIGHQKGSYTPHSYDVTRLIRDGENVVMTEVTAVAGVGGMLQDVYLELHPALAPEHLLLRAYPDHPQSGRAETATVDFELSFVAAEAGEVTWSATVRPETFEGEPVTLSGFTRAYRGWNRVFGRIPLTEPRLWWTWDQGRPDMYRFAIQLQTADGQQRRSERLFGVRTVEFRDWTLFLNGRRIFLRGAAYGPADLRRAAVPPELYTQDLAQVTAAHLNTLWVREHVGRAALYEEASRRGILIWQEIPGGLPDSEEVAALVDRVGSWPAVAVWQASEAPDREKGLFSRVADRLARSAQLNTVEKTLASMDHCRPGLSRLDSPGLFRGDTPYRTLPDKARFVLDAGPPAFPDAGQSRRFITDAWPNINWALLGAQRLEAEVPTSLAQSFEQYVAASQHHQAWQLRRLIEHFRQRKYRPCFGILLARFVDGEPAVTPSLLDCWREPKAAYETVGLAFRPVNILAEWPQSSYNRGEEILLGVTLINDRSERYEGRWSWTLGREGDILAQGGGEALLTPDCNLSIEGGIRWKVPDTIRPGSVELTLTLTLPGTEPITNRYGFDLLS